MEFGRQTAIVLNGRSGGRDAITIDRELRDALSAARIDADVAIAMTGTELTRLARSAAAGPATTLVGGGGDGTIAAIATQAVASGKTLGVLPLGAFNYFARRLGIPVDLAGAVAIPDGSHVPPTGRSSVITAVFSSSCAVNVTAGQERVSASTRPEREALTFNCL